MERQKKTDASDKSEKSEGWGERGSRWLRNINALGAAAFTGAAVAFPAFGEPLLALAGLDAAQAAFFEGTRRLSKRRQQKLEPATA